MVAMQARVLGAAGPAPICSARQDADATFAVSLAPLLSKYIDADESIFLPPNILGACGTIATVVSNGPFHRGFDIEGTRANNDEMAGVRVDCPLIALACVMA
jgi:hypothetical protein